MRPLLWICPLWGLMILIYAFVRALKVFYVLFRVLLLKAQMFTTFWHLLTGGPQRLATCVLWKCTLESVLLGRGERCTQCYSSMCSKCVSYCHNGPFNAPSTYMDTYCGGGWYLDASWWGSTWQYDESILEVEGWKTKDVITHENERCFS